MTPSRRNTAIAGTFALVLVALTLCASAGEITTLKPHRPAGQTRTISFPSDQCMGNLYTEPESGPRWDPRALRPSGQWRYLDAATGGVRVPEDKDLKLWIQLALSPAESKRFAAQNPNAYQLTVANRVRKDPHDLSGLSGLDPNDLFWLTVSTEMYMRPAVDPETFSQISHLTGLQILTLYSAGITDDALKLLRPLHSLRGLEITQMSISSRGLAHLTDLPALEYLSLNTAATDADLKQVAKMSNLRWLRITDGKMWGPGLAELAKLPRLERLCIAQSRSRLLDWHIKHIEPLTQLKSLTLWAPGCDTLTDSALASIAKLENLEELYFIRTNPKFTPAGVAHLKDLKKLRKISFAQTWGGPREVDVGDQVAVHLAAMRRLESIEGVSYLSADGVKALATLANLKELSISLKSRRQGYSGPTGLSHLASLRSLDKLGIDSGNILSASDLAGLESMTALRDLRVSPPGVTDEALALIGKIKQLERLDIYTMTRGGLNHLNGLSNLEYLTATARPDIYRPVGDELTLDLSAQTKMKELHLSEMSLTDADLAFLPNMSRLEILMIQPRSPISAACMRHLRQLPELNRLFIGRISHCRAEDLANLNGLPKLRNLRLSGNVTDTALASIDGPASLETIRIETDNPIRKQTITDLTAKHPLLEYVHIHPPSITSAETPNVLQRGGVPRSPQQRP